MDKKLKLLQEIFGDYYQTHQKNGEEYLFYCPKCQSKKRKLSFNIIKDCFKCWVCSYAGNSIYWSIKQFGSDSQAQQWNNLNGNIDFAALHNQSHDAKEAIILPKEYISLATHKPNTSTFEARIYLKNRGISFYDMVKWKMGVCLEGKYKGRIIIPSFDLNGNLDYFVARSYDNHPIHYLNPPLTKDLIFNSLFAQWSKDIILTEGVFDCIVAENAVPLLGSTLQEDSLIFKTIINNCKKIYIALDPDAEIKEKRIIKLFLMYGLEVFKIKVKPFRDLGVMTKEVYHDRKQNATPITTYNDIEMALEE